MFDFRTTKLGRYINKNIIGIIVGIVCFILIIVIIQILNQQAINNQELESTNTTAITTDPTSETIISGGDVSEEKNEENKLIIDTFIEYCNNGEIEKAYDLISIDCKEELYPTVEQFKNLYWIPVFQTSKSYSMQSWISSYDKYTYKVRLLEDMLATGKYNNSAVIEDYYTVIKSEEGYKISINSYINKEEINKSKEENLNKFTIVSKQVYMDYEVYTIEVKNNSQNTILLDSKEILSNTYLVGENDVNYSSYMDEVTIEELRVDAGQTKRIEIKFNKMYNPSLSIKLIKFTDIIQDYDTYLSNKNEYEGRIVVQIEI